LVQNSEIDIVELPLSISISISMIDSMIDSCLVEHSLYFYFVVGALS
jgi:hypothetical protein